MRLAIFGGTFDPPHLGHFLAATDALEQLALDRLIFVPAATQPLKADRTAAPAADRLAMVRLMVDGDARFDVSAIEVERAGLSFTVDTLTHFAVQYPAADRFLLVGADVLPSFGQWREPERIMALAEVVVLERPGEEGSEPRAASLTALRRLPTRRIDVSATEIRARVHEGRSVRGFVTDSVAAYIASHGLYR